MGLLERWDERNQAWADRKRIEPVRPLRMPFSGFFAWAAAVLWTAVFVSSVVHGAWVSAAVHLPGPLLVALVGWAWVRGRTADA